MILKHLKLFDTFTNKIVIGIDIDGTINNFSDAYNSLFKKNLGLVLINLL